jgi:lipoate-protein ligase B
VKYLRPHWCRRKTIPTPGSETPGDERIGVSTRLGLLDLGHRGYAETLELQRALCRRRMAGELDRDLLLLVEHEPVVTLGRGTRTSSLPLPASELERRGVAVHEVERGGDVTYHGPGQLVGYPILDLREHREDLHWYLRRLEDALIGALGGLGIAAARNPGLTGVWTAGRKIASIGIHVKQWVTFHGFALNVINDLSPFGLIVPCGIQDVVMTSVAAELGRADVEALWQEARTEVVASFAEVFGYRAVESAEEVAPAGAADPASS